MISIKRLCVLLHQMIQEEEEEEDNGEPRYIEPLGAALAQRGKKKGSDKLSFDNPAFSTTDLWWSCWGYKKTKQNKKNFIMALC